MHSVKILVLIPLAVICAGVASARAADLSISPRPQVPVRQSNGLPAGCLEWTDGCRVCLRAADGSASCSNPGIACLLQKPRCTRQ